MTLAHTHTPLFTRSLKDTVPAPTSCCCAAGVFCTWQNVNRLLTRITNTGTHTNTLRPWDCRSHNYTRTSDFSQSDTSAHPCRRTCSRCGTNRGQCRGALFLCISHAHTHTCTRVFTSPSRSVTGERVWFLFLHPILIGRRQHGAGDLGVRVLFCFISPPRFLSCNAHTHTANPKNAVTSETYRSGSKMGETGGEWEGGCAAQVMTKNVRFILQEGWWCCSADAEVTSSSSSSTLPEPWLVLGQGLGGWSDSSFVRHSNRDNKTQDPDPRVQRVCCASFVLHAHSLALHTAATSTNEGT